MQGSVRLCVNALFELNDDYTLTTSMNHYTYDPSSVLEQKCGKSWWFHPPAITIMGLLQSSAQFNAANCILWSLSHVMARRHSQSCEGIIVFVFFAVILQWWFIKSWCCWWRSWGEAQLSCSASPGRPFESTRGLAAAAAAVCLVCPCHGVSTNNNKQTIISSNYLLCLGFSLIVYGLMQCFLNHCAH